MILQICTTADNKHFCYKSSNMNVFIETITSTDAAKRNRSFFEISSRLSPKELLAALRELDSFRKSTSNLYDKVRAILFLYAGFRFFLMEAKETPAVGKISYAGFEDLLARRFEQAIAAFLQELEEGVGDLEYVIEDLLRGVVLAIGVFELEAALFLDIEPFVLDLPTQAGCAIGQEIDIASRGEKVGQPLPLCDWPGWL